MPAFKFTAKQDEAQALLRSQARHIMLAGGSRSGKTLLFVRAIIARALAAKGSRHAILRFRFGHVKQSIVHDTFPKVMALCFPGVRYELNRSDWFAQINGSEVWFGGLDDKERTEKILGTEFATILLNECSQIPYSSRNMALTRLAQLVKCDDGKPLPLRMYYDENPPDKGHWTYKLFKLHQDPDTKAQLDPADYAFMQLNPGDNRENLAAEYIQTLEALPARLRKRFLEGEFRDATQGALFSDEHIERWRMLDLDKLPDMLRVVVAIDPSGADDEDNFDNDSIGIVVCGLGVDGNGYVLEDLTCKAGPETWGRVATQAFDRHRADRIVAETNFGGAMVGAVIRGARARTPYRAVTASRGKIVRAEPISALVESGKIRMAGIFRDLEDELTAFTTHGYMGEHSPNRADAMIWGFSELFPELAAKPEPTPKTFTPTPRRGGPNAWMHQ